MESITAKSNSYTNEIHRISKDSVLFKQSRETLEPHRVVDVGGNYWSFAVARLDTASVSLIHQNQSVAVQGLVGIYAPHFSVLEWNLQPDSISCQVVLSTAPLPALAPRTAKLFALETDDISIDQIHKTIESGSKCVDIDRICNPHRISQQLAALIQNNFKSNCPITDLCIQIGKTNAYCTKVFKHDFGIPPTEYRNQLRVNCSMLELLHSDKSITEQAFDSGFNDLSCFNKQFKKYIATSPSQYKF